MECEQPGEAGRIRRTACCDGKQTTVPSTGERGETTAVSRAAERSGTAVECCEATVPGAGHPQHAPDACRGSTTTVLAGTTATVLGR